MRTVRFQLAVAGLILGALTLKAEETKVSEKKSSVRFSTRYLMVTSIKGHFTKFDGRWRIDPKTGKLAALEGAIRTESVDTGNKGRNKRLRTSDFFDAKNSEFVKFRLKEYKGDDKGGKARTAVTIRGVTRDLDLDVRIDKTSGTLTLRGKLNRFDFDIGKSYSKAVVGTNVLVDLELAGIAR